MHNRVAAELLGTAVGEGLEGAVAALATGCGRSPTSCAPPAPRWPAPRCGWPAAEGGGEQRVVAGLGAAARSRRALGAAGRRGRDRGPAQPAPPRLGGDGAHDRPRDQEPAHPDPPVDRAHGGGLPARSRALRPRLRALHQQHPDPGGRAALDRLRVLGLQLDPADRSQAGRPGGEHGRPGRGVPRGAAAGGVGRVRAREPGDRRPLRRQAPAPGRAQPDRERPARHRRRAGGTR